MKLAPLALGAATALQQSHLLRRAAWLAAALALCLGLGAVVLAFAAIATFILLADWLGAAGAAAAVAGIGVALIGIVILIARGRRRPAVSPLPITTLLSASAISNPIGTSLTSVAAGFILGLLLRSGR